MSRSTFLHAPRSLAALALSVLAAAMVATVVGAPPAWAATAPGAPSIGAVVAASTQLSVGFLPPSSNGGSVITSYTASCTPAGGSASTASGVSSPLVVTGLTNGTSYTCRVTATNVVGTSAASTGRTGTPRTVPGAPTITTLSAGNGQVRAVIGAPGSDGGAPITRYGLTCTPAGGGAPRSVRSTSPVTLTGLTNAVAHSCTAVAVNAAGDSAASDPESATPAAVPGPPTAGSATPGDGSLAMSFTAPSVSGASAVSGYTVSCTPVGGGTAVTGTGSTSPVTVTGLTNGTAYSCSVVATNSTGDSLPSAAVTGTPRTVPVAPTLTSVTAADRGLDVAVALAGTGGAAITAVAVSCTPAGGSAVTAVAKVAGVVRVRGLVNGTEYTCSATATNVAGASAASDPSTGTPVAVPSPPQVTLSVLGNAQVEVAFSAPASNGGSAVTGYTVSCAARGGAPVTGTGSTSPVTVTGLTNGSLYSCTVVATNAAGSSPSSAGVWLVPRTVPGSPTVTAANAGDARLSVVFSAPGSNGGNAVTAYTATCVDADANSFSGTGSASPVVVTGLVNGTAYSCSATATNVAGTGAASATMSGTPYRVPAAPAIGAMLRSNRQLKIGFSTPAANGNAILGYGAQCVVAGRTVTATGPSSPITLTGLDNGKLHTCQVRARNSAGWGPWSAADSAKPATVPTAPAVTAVTPSGNDVTVVYTASTYNGGSPVLDYTAYCSQGGEAARTATVAASARQATVTGLDAGLEYSCHVRARNAIGESSSFLVGQQTMFAGIAVVGSTGQWRGMAVYSDGAVAVEDEFERADFATGGPAWQAVDPYPLPVISSGVAVGTAGASSAALVQFTAADATVQATVGDLPTGDDQALLRVTRTGTIPVPDFLSGVGAGGAMQGLGWNASESNFTCGTFAPGMSGTTLAPGDVLRLERLNANVAKVYVNGTEVASVDRTVSAATTC